MKKKNIVVSAVNLVNGGTFSILLDCVDKLVKINKNNDYNLYVLVNSKKSLPFYDNITYLEFPLSKKNWLFRLYYEYIYFYFLSIKLKSNVWISLHDMTPNVKADKQYVYMHNPTPFYNCSKKEKLSFKLRLFIKFYKYLYKINVKKNTAIIVQQDWLRNDISVLCKVPKEKIIVSYPETDTFNIKKTFVNGIFFFPSFPREFKNFEVICKAANILKNECSISKKWEIILTIDGTENFYSKDIYTKYSHIDNIKFIGLQNRENMIELYNNAECLIFPSKLETWGLPISEFKSSSKKMILSDLPYAKETSNGATQVCFFNPNDENILADIMFNVINEDYNQFNKNEIKNINQPFFLNWNDLLQYLIS